MSKIYVQDGVILLEDTSRPIFLFDQTTDKHRTILLKDVHDAVALTGVAREEVVAMADAEGKKTPQNGYTFIWPELKDVKKAWPNYRVQKPNEESPFVVAVPCEVTLKTRPGSKKKDKLYYRSITSTCSAWSISKETFDKVANQHLGWQDHLPTMMAAIRTNVKPPKDYYKDGEAEDGALFKLKSDAKGGVVLDGTKYVGKRWERIQDVPAAILAAADWEAGGKVFKFKPKKGKSKRSKPAAHGRA